MGRIDTMSTDVKISVVVPLYNKSKTIVRCLSSIVLQSFPDWDCVVVDDGSTDDGADRARQLSDARIRVYSQSNSGPGAARNRGAVLARAPLLAFLDADDEWDREYLHYHFAVLEAFGDVSASVSSHRRAGRNVTAADPFRSLDIVDGVWRLPPQTPPEHVKAATDFMCAGCVVVRRDVFWKYGGFYDRNRCTYGEDTHLWLPIVANELLYRSPTALMSYHLEDSVLGLGRKSIPPPWPMLYQSRAMVNRCRPEARSALESALAYYAVLAANRLLVQGRWLEARKILRLNDFKPTPDSRAYIAAQKKTRGLLFRQPYYLLRRTLRQIAVLTTRRHARRHGGAVQ
jgi:glycosyltransferase involved in cell wall biosynthesis